MYDRPPATKPQWVTLGQEPPTLTVVCVWWGDKYGMEYVTKLCNMVKRHLPIPHDFICITSNGCRYDDFGDVIRMAPFVNDEGWWQKIGLFHPDIFGRGQRILYLDLDIVIKSSLFDIVRAQEPFCMIRNFGPNVGYCAHNSSVMLWTPGPDTYQIYEKFGPQVKALHGDQDWIWRVMHPKVANFQDGMIQSNRYDRINHRSAIVVYHGEGKPHELKDDLIVQNHWK